MPNRGKRAVAVFIFACSLIAGEAGAAGVRQTDVPGGRIARTPGLIERIGRFIAKLKIPITAPVAGSQELTPPIPAPPPQP